MARKLSSRPPPRPRVITMYGQKGGGGKSTVATNLAAEGVRRGLRVLLVDLDPQGSASDWHADADAAAQNGSPPPPDLALTLAVPMDAYDLVVIDVPAKYDESQGAALLAADVAIIPVAPTKADLRVLGRSLPLLKEAQRRRPELRAVLLIARNKNAVRSARGRAALAPAGVPILDAEIGDRFDYQDAFAAGLGVTTYQPSGAAAAEIRALYDELERGASS